MPIGNKIYHFTQSEITGLFKTAHRIYKGQALDVLRAPAANPYGRILAIVSGKMGNAPQRNKVKRQIKAIFYEERLFEHPFDIIVIAKKPLMRMTFQEIKKLLLATLLP